MTREKDYTRRGWGADLPWPKSWMAHPDLTLVQDIIERNVTALQERQARLETRAAELAERARKR